MTVERTSDLILARLESARLQAVHRLLESRGPACHWEGELSSSALSTATAVTALAVARREGAAAAAHADGLILRGLDWLAAHANPDGGWGDTIRSVSNISTTTLVWAAFGAAGSVDHPGAVAGAERWLTAAAGSLNPEILAKTLIARYGKDRTFSVPILTHCALAGRLGPGADAWRHVLPLPFELAALPQSWFAAARFPVVSYALPALIAIGQAREYHRPSTNPLIRAIRRWAARPTLELLDRIQPVNGGFLEATPLTSFVTMSLAGSGHRNHPVTRRGLEFLRNAVRLDGSWPIDTHLATWVSTLAINALTDPDLSREARSLEPGPEDRRQLTEWLLNQQYRVRHPYTGSPPGGWAWTPLPGGVPDADDTAGALLALDALGAIDPRISGAVEAGLGWLIGLQNRDGGIPTFCRGWGTLPFDRSSPDLTAHALRAWNVWHGRVAPALGARLRRAAHRACNYLERTQQSDGSWVPLWFGNQHHAREENPVYGTARVVPALSRVGADGWGIPQRSLERGLEWLMKVQRGDGGWSSAPEDAGSATVEETALAVEALASVALDRIRRGAAPDVGLIEAVRGGAAWLIRAVEDGRFLEPAPIGFYFARLWYFERLYPLIFTTAALTRASAALKPTEPGSH